MAQTHLKKCPHCGEQTEVEEPAGDFDGTDTVEVQQDCGSCALPVIAVFRVRYVLREVLKG